MPVSTSAMTMDVAPWVIAHAGSMLMLESTLRPLASTPGARRYHWPEAGPLGATAVELMPLAFITCVRSPRMRPSVSARPRRAPSAVAFCGPAAAADEPAPELD